MIRVMLTAVALAASGAVLAKLPAPTLDDAAKAKAAEAAAKTAWQGKVDAYKLCQAQDRVVAHYRRNASSRPAVAVPAGAVTPTAATPAAAPKTPSNSGNPTTTAQGGGTPVASVAAAAPPPPCADPGPFAYAPPAQKPLETSGAHSPAANASSPPSVKNHSAEMAPAKPSTASPAPAKKP